MKMKRKEGVEDDGKNVCIIVDNLLPCHSGVDMHVQPAPVSPHIFRMIPPSLQ